MEFKFKPQDFQKAFETGEAYHGSMLDEMAAAANAKLEEWFKGAVEVFGGKTESLGTTKYPDGAWRFHEDRGGYPWDVTHRALLVEIRKLPGVDDVDGDLD